MPVNATYRPLLEALRAENMHFLYDFLVSKEVTLNRLLEMNDKDLRELGFQLSGLIVRILVFIEARKEAKKKDSSIVIGTHSKVKKRLRNELKTGLQKRQPGMLASRRIDKISCASSNNFSSMQLPEWLNNCNGDSSASLWPDQTKLTRHFNLAVVQGGEDDRYPIQRPVRNVELLPFQSIELASQYHTEDVDKDNKSLSGVVMNAGGPVWAMDACPRQIDGSTLLAVGTFVPKDSDQGPSVDVTAPWERRYDTEYSEDPNLIQFWRVTSMDQCDQGKGGSQMVGAIGTLGDVLDIRWANDLVCGAHSVGLLGVVYLNGSVALFDVPVSLLEKHWEKESISRAEVTVAALPPYQTVSLPSTKFNCIRWGYDSPNEFLLGGTDGSVTLWTTISEVGKVSSVPLGQYVAASSACNRSRPWITVTQVVAWCPYHAKLFVSGHNDGCVRIWHRDNTRSPLAEYKLHDILGDGVIEVAWAPHAEGLFLTGFANAVVFLDLITSVPSRLYEHSVLTLPVWDLAIVSDPSVVSVPVISSCGADGRLRLLPLADNGAELDASVLGFDLVPAIGRASGVDLKLSMNIRPLQVGNKPILNRENVFLSPLEPNKNPTLCRTIWTAKDTVISSGVSGLIRVQHIPLNELLEVHTVLGRPRIANENVKIVTVKKKLGRPRKYEVGTKYKKKSISTAATTKGIVASGRSIKRKGARKMAGSKKGDEASSKKGAQSVGDHGPAGQHKKKRGRPPKNAQAKPKETKSKEAKPKRGPGRPRKRPLSDVPEGEIGETLSRSRKQAKRAVTKPPSSSQDVEGVHGHELPEKDGKAHGSLQQVANKTTADAPKPQVRRGTRGKGHESETSGREGLRKRRATDPVLV